MINPYFYLFRNKSILVIHQYIEMQKYPDAYERKTEETLTKAPPAIVKVIDTLLEEVKRQEEEAKRQLEAERELEEAKGKEARDRERAQLLDQYYLVLEALKLKAASLSIYDLEVLLGHMRENLGKRKRSPSPE